MSAEYGFYLNVALSIVGMAKELLLNGKAQYSWPPCTNQFRSAAFDIVSIMQILYKTNYSNEEVNCTEPSTSVRVLWYLLQTMTKKLGF